MLDLCHLRKFFYSRELGLALLCGWIFMVCRRSPGRHAGVNIGVYSNVLAIQNTIPHSDLFLVSTVHREL